MKKKTDYEMANDVIRRAGKDPDLLTERERFDIVVRHLINFKPKRRSSDDTDRIQES